MTGKIKRRSLRCGGRPKADFGSIFTTFIAPALGVAGSVADSAISKTQVSKSNTKPAIKETNTEVTNNNTSVENLPTTQAPTKEPISGLVTSNTVIPPDPTKTPAMRLGGRKKCWIGAAIMGATSIAGSLFGAAAQKREMRRQKNIQDWQNTTQEAANMTTALNNSRDYQEDYLRQFRTAARLGKTLGAKGIYITDGGDATKIGNNTYLLRGGSHEDVNETGQTGIGINVGGNEVEAEGGEVAQKKNGALRIFSAQPILGNGMSPAQAILRGYNKDKVFSQQQAFKKRNGLKDDGSKAKWGIGWLDSLFGDNTPKKTVHFYKSQATGKVFKTRQEAIAENNKYKTDLGYRRNINREREVEAAIRKQGNERIPYIKEKEIKLTNAGKLTGARLSTNQLDSIAKYASKAGLPIKTALGLVGQESAFGNYFGYANNAKDLNTYNTQPKEVRDKYGIPAYKIVNYENLIPERTPTNVDDFAINKRYGKRSVTGFGFPTITNGKELDRLKLQHEAYPALQRKRSKFWRDINTPTLQLAFEHYKTSPQTYNAGNPNQQNLVNNKANDVWGSPEIQEWYRTSPYVKHRLGGRCKLRNGGLTSKDRGSSKHPYPSVSSKDFAGGGRSYPIPTKADAVDALRLAGLHGRGDVKAKVYSRYPELRKKSLLGSSSRPVKYIRPKAAIGIYTPFNKRYTSIYDAPDYDSDYNGGNVLGNGEVTVTAKRIKPTFMKPNNDAMNIINHPANETPYIPQHHNRSRTIFSGGDYLGLGIDTLAALSTGLVNYNTAGKYVLPDRAPIIQASKLPTTYNVNPEIEEVKRYRDRLTGQTFNNTSSSVAALNRSGAINLDALSNLSKLWATKENEENKMLTEDAKNQQTVAAQNVQNELARQSEIARIKNEATQAKGDALNVGLSGLSQAWTNFWTAGRTAYEDDQSRRAMIASSKEATPTRLSEMDFDLSPDILASLYRTAKDDRTKRFYLSRLSPKQRQKYGIN